MKTSEINLPVQGFTLNANIYRAGSHIKMLMLLGRILPTTKAQAKLFIKDVDSFDVLNMDDALLIDALMTKHSLTADFRFTKSKTSVRLMNIDDFKTALKLEYLENKKVYKKVDGIKFYTESEYNSFMKNKEYSNHIDHCAESKKYLN